MPGHILGSHVCRSSNPENSWRSRRGPHAFHRKNGVPYAKPRKAVDYAVCWQLKGQLEHQINQPFFTSSRSYCTKWWKKGTNIFKNEMWYVFFFFLLQGYWVCKEPPREKEQWIQIEKLVPKDPSWTLYHLYDSRVYLSWLINSYSASHDNWCTVILWNRINYNTVRGDGGSRVGEVRADTTSPMPEHKGFKLQ